MSVTKSHLFYALFNLDLGRVKTYQAHLISGYFTDAKLADVSSSPSVDFSILANDRIMVATCLSILGILNLRHLLWGFKAHIVAMAEAAAAAIAPGVDFSLGHQTEAVLEATRDEQGFLPHEQLEDLITD